VDFARTKWLAREGRLQDESCGIVGNVITDIALCLSTSATLCTSLSLGIFSPHPFFVPLYM
jgi:hypothetical protein